MSLTEVMLVIGICGIIVVGLTKFSGDQMKTTKQIQDRIGLEGLKQAIRLGFSCENTLQVKPEDKVSECRSYTIMNRQNKAFLGAGNRYGSSDIFIHLGCHPQRGLAFEYRTGNLRDGQVSGQESIALFPGEYFCTEYFRDDSEAEPAFKYHPVLCATGRVIVGIQNGVPVCGYSGGDLRGPPTCVVPESGGSAVCTYSNPPTLPTNCSMSPSVDGVLVETCQ